jgi:hypothetical protein
MMKPDDDFNTIDINDGKPWSSAEDEVLIAAIISGASLDEAATLLCRSGTLADVLRRALHLGVHWPREQLL